MQLFALDKRLRVNYVQVKASSTIIYRSPLFSILLTLPVDSVHAACVQIFLFVSHRKTKPGVIVAVFQLY